MMQTPNENETSTATSENTSPTATEQPKYVPHVEQPNRAQRRAKTKLRLTKKVKNIRGKLLYGIWDITDMMKIDVFKHPYTAVKALMMDMTAGKVKAFIKAQEEAQKVKPIEVEPTQEIGTSTNEIGTTDEAVVA